MKKNARIRVTRREQGYMLLSVMLVMTLMLIALSVELPRISQQIRREKEEELVHRGREYAIAIKRFYHKTGTYPASLEQLESTNNLRFLRKRFKDPMTEKGEFKLVHVGEAQITMPKVNPGINNAQPGGATPNSGLTGSAGLNSNTGATGSGLGGGLNSGSGGLSTGGLNSGGTGGLSTGGLGTGGLGSGTQGSSTTTGATAGTLGTAQPATGQVGTLTTQGIGNGIGGQGGGQVIGVASTSKKTSIKSFNEATEYDQWLFVYDPKVEQAGGGGVTIAAPSGMGTTTGSDGLPQPVQPVRTPQ
jgi:type II secretory pathway pseudopilin PulG